MVVTVVQEWFQIGGQVGISGHLTIGNNVRIAAQSGIAKDIPDGMTVQGSPAFPKLQHDRSHVIFRKLPELLKRIADLERELAELRRNAQGNA